MKNCWFKIRRAKLSRNVVSPCEAFPPRHPPTSQCMQPLPWWKIAQIVGNPTGVREGRGWASRNMKKMRRSWFFLTSSMGWPLSSSSMERRSFLSSTCKLFVRCTQRGWASIQWMDGWTQADIQLTLTPILTLLQYFFFIETCMPLHLLLPSLLTADLEVLFRTEGLYLVFQSNNFNVWVDTIDEEPWVLLHSIMYDSLLSKYVITALSYNNYVIFLDRSNWNLLCREVITAYFSSFVSEWVAFMGKKKIMHAQNSL